MERQVILFLSLTIALGVLALVTRSAEAAGYEFTRVNETEIKLCVTPAAGESIKDIHLPKGNLADGAVVPVVGLPAGWAVDVANKHINIFGPNGLPGGQNCFNIGSPAGHKWGGKTGTVIFTSDGDNDPTDSQIGGGGMPFVPVSFSDSVGGIAGLVDGSAASAVASSDSRSVGAPLAVASTVGALSLLAVAGGWYLRRRFSRN